MLYAVKIPIIGLTNIVEVLVNDFINNLSGVDGTKNEEEASNVSETEVEENQNLSTNSEGTTGELTGNESQQGSEVFASLPSDEQESRKQEETEAGTQNQIGPQDEKTEIEKRKLELNLKKQRNILEVNADNEEKFYEPKATDNNANRLNIEDVIYNKIPLLDVNLFSFDTAGFKREVKQGEKNVKQQLPKDSVIYTIRTNIAAWYFSIRIVSIILELLVLIYLGIQLAINNAAGKRANYQEMLRAWVTSFIIVFSIHYYMVFVVEVNEFFVNLCRDINEKSAQTILAEEAVDDKENQALLKYANGRGGISLYDTIRTRAYSFKLTEGTAGTIMYMVLVYYLIKFLYIYFKRYLVVNILALLGPIMAVKYAFDKIKRGTGSSFTSWMFDFFINVFLQSVHALLYTVCISVAFELSTKSLGGFVLALMVLHFVLKAEKLFMSIFKFDSRGASLKDTMEQKSVLKETAETVIGVGMFAKGTVKFGIGGMKLIGNTALNIFDSYNFGIAIDNRAAWREYKKKKAQSLANGEEPPQFIPEQRMNAKKELKDKFENLKDTIGDKINDGFEKFGNFEDKVLGDYEGLNVPFTGGKKKWLKLNNRIGGRKLSLDLHKIKETNPELYKATKKALDENKKQVHKQWKRTLTTGSKAIGGMAKVLVGVPAAIVNPEGGFYILASGVNNLVEVSSGKKHYGHKQKHRIKTKRGKIGKIAKGALAVAASPGIAVPALTVGAIANKIRNKKHPDNNLEKVPFDINSNGFTKAVSEISTVGEMAVINGFINETNEVKKDVERNNKSIEKLRYIAEVTKLEDEITKEAETIKLLEEQEKNEKSTSNADNKKADKKEEKDEKQEKIKVALNSVISAAVVKATIKEYMFQYNITKVTSEDINKILAELKIKADAEIKNTQYEYEFNSEFKSYVKQQLGLEVKAENKKRKRGRKPKEPETEVAYNEEQIAKAIEDAFVQNDVLVEKQKQEKKDSNKKDKPENELSATRQEIENRYIVLNQKIKQLKVATQKAKIATGSPIVNANKFVNKTVLGDKNVDKSSSKKEKSSNRYVKNEEKQKNETSKKKGVNEKNDTKNKNRYINNEEKTKKRQSRNNQTSKKSSTKEDDKTKKGNRYINN